MDNKGFTLVELIVVITVIGILMGGAALSLTSYASNSRDTRRKTDLQQIKAALEFYRSNNVNGFYPQGTGGAEATRYHRVNSFGLTVYELVEARLLDEMLFDPLNTNQTYPYFPTTAAGGACDNATATTMCTTYTLRATGMENEAVYSVTPLSTN